MSSTSQAVSRTERIAGDGPLLDVENLEVSFATDKGSVLAVDDVSFSVERGHRLGIVGESGSGKSVMCRAVMNILAPRATVGDRSSIRFHGRELEAMTKQERKHFWGVDVAMVFQDPMTSLTPVMTVGAQLSEPLRYHLGMSKSQARTEALDLLEQVGIPDPRQRIDVYPHNLSGGMRQRVSIALALACSPSLLIADEPTTALDVTIQQQILNLLEKLCAERDMALVIVSHDLGVIASRTDEVLVMYAGQIVERGETARVMSEPRHPYTRGLLDAIPALDRPSHTRLTTIPGRLTPRRRHEDDCYFANRCDRAQDVCTAGVAVHEEVGHRVACNFPIGITPPQGAGPRSAASGSSGGDAS